jgi:hypothetical protein
VNRCRAYGLNIRSELDLPELLPAPADSPVDVEVAFRPIDGPLPQAGPRLVEFDPQGAYLAWPTIGRFRIEGHSTIAIDALTDDPQRVRFALLGPVLAALLQLRGVPLLHGSAVAFEGSAVAFIGRKRAGKSTIAAACVAAGGAMLNDDVLPLDTGSSPVSLVPGFPGLKLEEAMRQALLPGLPIVGPPGLEPSDKILVADGTQTASNLPISAIVVLQPDAALEPVRLPASVALQELLQHGYALKFADGTLASGQAPALFQACVRLTRETSVLSVGPPREPKELRDFAGDLLAQCVQKSLLSC